MSTITLTDEQVAAICADLARGGDGTTIALPNEQRLTLRIEADDYLNPVDHINDCDAYGKVAWCNRDRHTHDDAPRPDGFTGRAIKLRLMGGERVWWEPYHDGGAYTPPTSAERQFMEELLTFGFKEVGLILTEQTTDSRGGEHWVTVASQWIGGIDTLDQVYPKYVHNGYLVDGILPDLIAEVLA